jgi:hypothetical protein
VFISAESANKLNQIPTGQLACWHDLALCSVEPNLLVFSYPCSGLRVSRVASIRPCPNKLIHYSFLALFFVPAVSANKLNQTSTGQLACSHDIVLCHVKLNPLFFSYPCLGLHISGIGWAIHYPFLALFFVC